MVVFSVVELFTFLNFTIFLFVLFRKIVKISNLTGLKYPQKGGRLIVVHAVTENGLVPGAACIFRSDGKSADYHSDMNADNFLKWFNEQLIPNLDPRTVIVMDNASYHNTKNPKVPLYGFRKAVKQQFLQEHRIPFDEKMKVSQLDTILKQAKPRIEKYATDTVAELANKDLKILRLPPYHCELNPIELVWSSFKSRVAAKNTMQKLDFVQNLAHEVFHEMPTLFAKNCFQHVRKLEDQFWKKDSLDQIQKSQVV